MAKILRRIGLERIRRALIILCAVLVLLALQSFFSLQISETHNGTSELINGQADTSALIAPLVLFIVGGAGLLAMLGWHPDE